EIKDCKAPTPYCLTGIITVPMASTGCIDIWAKDLNFGSFDNCTSKDKLKLYFDGIKSKTSIRVCCEDFEKARANDELRIDVRLYVEDEEGNKDYCSTVIIVQDNQNICKNVGSLLTVSGEMKTESGIGTSNTKVDIYNEGLLIDSKITNTDGKYVFNDIIPFTNYLIKPLRNDDPLNGVSTSDIVKIQKHILGKELLNSPFKLIAADVNNSNSITSADIAEIRKLILGVIPNFSKVNSWKFVPSSTRFEDITAPWEYKTDFNVNIKDKSEKVDFVSIKMADVNESASANLSKPISARSTQKLEFVINDAKIEVGESYGIDFKVKDLIRIQGFQFTFNFNNNLLLFESLTAGLISMTEANVGINNLNKGKLTISWNADQILTLDPNTTLFTLNFKALGNSRLRNNLIISSDITTAEYYNEFMDNGSIELYLKGSGQITDASIFELIGGAPNPFKEFIDISLRLPESAPVVITIYDAVGKVHRVIQINGTKGLNIARINKKDLAGSGMYYYHIDAAHNTATGKMVLID
ncbi:MAG: T9SS type A sorting domain-containing protein, partial [Saprospiraceae bacterium]